MQPYIFIVGCARTGTTLLRQILSLSGRICIAPETHFIRRFAWTAGRRVQDWGDLGNDANLDRMIDFMFSGREEAGSAYWGWLERNMDREYFRDQMRQSDRTERGMFQVLMQVYAEKMKGKHAPDLVLGEKTPGHLNHIPTLLEWFPSAKIIHTFRDPRAILISELKKMRKKDREGPRRIFRSMPRGLIEPLELPFELVHTTRSWLAAAHYDELCQARYPNNYALVRFEDLVTAPERQVRRLCGFLDIPFEPAMVSEVRVVGSSDQSSHRGAAGFDRSALDRWKASFPPALELWFRFLAGRQMEKFGYA